MCTLKLASLAKMTPDPPIALWTLAIRTTNTEFLCNYDVICAQILNTITCTKNGTFARIWYWSKQGDRGGSGVIFASEAKMKVPIAGVSTLFTE